MLGEHHAATESLVSQHGGAIVGTTGDGVLATFNIPSAAIDAALGLRDRLQRDGLSMRAAIHTGEVEQTDDDLSGAGRPHRDPAPR